MKPKLATLLTCVVVISALVAHQYSDRKHTLVRYIEKQIRPQMYLILTDYREFERKMGRAPNSIEEITGNPSILPSFYNRAFLLSNQNDAKAPVLAVIGVAGEPILEEKIIVGWANGEVTVLDIPRIRVELPNIYDEIVRFRGKKMAGERANNSHLPTSAEN